MYVCTEMAGRDAGSCSLKPASKEAASTARAVADSIVFAGRFQCEWEAAFGKASHCYARCTVIRGVQCAATQQVARCSDQGVTL